MILTGFVSPRVEGVRTETYIKWTQQKEDVMSRQVLAAAALLCFAATASESQILAEYKPSPLTDQIRVSNISNCPTGPLEIGIYLSSSVGELVISGDPSANRIVGSKVQVASTGGDPVEVIAEVDAVYVTVSNFAPGHGIELEIDLSSELDDGELQSTRAAGSLISGAEAVVTAPNEKYRVGLFGRDGQAIVETPACLS